MIAPIVGEVAEGSPAAEAGLLAGDVIISVEGRAVSDFADVQQAIRIRPDESISLSYVRDGERYNASVSTGVVRVWDNVANDSVSLGVIGVTRASDEVAHRALGPAAAFGEGLRQTWGWTLNIGSFVGRIFSGQDSASELGGPIMIGQLSGQFARAGFLPFLQFMAIISVNLAVLNLLPIPVLDGGHLLFLAIEGVRGREVGVEQRIRLTQAGMLFVFGLMVLAIANDIFRLVG
jgi:regulator of sigma E protease